MKLTAEESAARVTAATHVLDAYGIETTAKGLDGKAVLEFTQSTLQ